MNDDPIANLNVKDAKQEERGNEREISGDMLIKGKTNCYGM